MRLSARSTAALALVLLIGIISAISSMAAPTGKAPTPIHDTNTQQLAAPAPASYPADGERHAEIKALDEKIKALRDQYKSQVDPLEAQVKSLREKFDADLKPLQDQRNLLVAEGESPELRMLNEQETSQIADLDSREKSEIEGIRGKYDSEKKQLRDSFSQKRHELLAKK